MLEHCIQELFQFNCWESVSKFVNSTGYLNFTNCVSPIILAFSKLNVMLDVQNTEL